MYLFSIKSLCIFNCLTRMLCLYTMIHNIISMFAIYNYMSSYDIYLYAIYMFIYMLFKEL